MATLEISDSCTGRHCYVSRRVLCIRTETMPMIPHDAVRYRLWLVPFDTLWSISVATSLCPSIDLLSGLGDAVVELMLQLKVR